MRGNYAEARTVADGRGCHVILEMKRSGPLQRAILRQHQNEEWWKAILLSLAHTYSNRKPAADLAITNKNRDIIKLFITT